MKKSGQLMKNKKIVFAVIIIICFIFFINIMSNTPQITINSKTNLIVFLKRLGIIYQGKEYFLAIILLVQTSYRE